MPALRFQQPPFEDNKGNPEPLPSSNEKLGRQGNFQLRSLLPV